MIPHIEKNIGTIILRLGRVRLMYFRYPALPSRGWYRDFDQTVLWWNRWELRF